jgi:broad specificity phosphatase PhoE
MRPPPLPTLYLLRHGETVWNAAGRFQGRLDSELTEKGRRQAHAMGAALARELGSSSSEYVLKVSPLGRASTTASIIAKQMPNLKIEEDDMLREISIGSWNGLTQFEIAMEYPGALQGATPLDWFFRSPEDANDRNKSLSIRTVLEGRPPQAFYRQHASTTGAARRIFLS